VVEFAGARWRFQRALGVEAILLRSEAGDEVSADPLQIRLPGTTASTGASPPLVDESRYTDADWIEATRRRDLLATLASKRIKSLCGAKPPQKLRWTNAGRWAAIDAMEILPRTLAAWADNRGSAGAHWLVRSQYRGREWSFQDDWQRHLEQSWAVGCVGGRRSPRRNEARDGKTERWRRKHTVLIMAPWPGAVSVAGALG
jgi:hypothetical protein